MDVGRGKGGDFGCGSGCLDIRCGRGGDFGSVSGAIRSCSSGFGTLSSSDERCKYMDLYIASPILQI